MGAKRPKKVIIENGVVRVWCSGHKQYFPEGAFYPVSGRKYDSYCKECRKEKEHSFYNRYKKGNPNYIPTIKRHDNAHLFIGEKKPKAKKDSPKKEVAPTVSSRWIGKDGKRLLVPRRLEYTYDQTGGESS